MAELAFDTFSVDSAGAPYQLVKITPPQTNDAEIPVGKGAYCFVIDVSGSCVNRVARKKIRRRPATSHALTLSWRPLSCERPAA